MTRLATATLALLLSAACYPYYDVADTGDTGDTGAPDVQECVWLGDQPTFASPGTVTGRVVSPSGTVPVLSALVELDVNGEAAWMLTQCGGAFSIDLPAGTHELHIGKGRYTAERSADIVAGETLDLGEIRLDIPDVSIAVIAGIYDDIGGMIELAGIPYTRISRPADLLDDPADLEQYDVIFSNCGSLNTTTDAAQYTPEQFSNVRDWLDNGGTLYTSDWEYELFAGAVPEGLNFSDNARQGPVSLIEADVLDRDIQTILGKETADLRFNLNDWAVADSSAYAYVLVEAEVNNRTRPLAALMPVGDGKAIFTSFHNEAQVTDDMEILLFEMILSL